MLERKPTKGERLIYHDPRGRPDEIVTVAGMDVGKEGLVEVKFQDGGYGIMSWKYPDGQPEGSNPFFSHMEEDKLHQEPGFNPADYARGGTTGKDRSRAR